ncbi:MAG: hypothetical protein Q7S52_05675 [bacterium]|nr:hypothetical protein [bacterium]
MRFPRGTFPISPCSTAGTFHLKLSDRLHNLSTCAALTPEAQWRMIEETEEHYLPIAKERGILHKELKKVIAERKRVLSSTKKHVKVELAPEQKEGERTLHRDGEWGSILPDAHGWYSSSHK